MHKENQNLVDSLKEIADIERAKGDVHRNRAYLKAIQTIRAYPKKIKSGEQALKLENIGKSIAAKIEELLKTGKIKKLVEMRKDPIIKAKEKFSALSGFGPGKIYDIISEGILNISSLKKAVKKGEISLTKHQELGLKYRKDTTDRIPHSEIKEFKKVLDKLSSEVDYNNKIEIAGSFRRKRPDSGDIDILITNKKDANVLRDFVKKLKSKGLLVDDISTGKSKYMGFGKTTKKGKIRRIDILVVPYETYGAALLYFTGSKQFNQDMREYAKNAGFLLNEKGLYRLNTTGKKLIKTKKEKDIFKELDLKYVKPEKRE